MPISDKDKELYVAIWAKVIDTQMHFNDMCVKSRQFGLAFVAAALGLAIVLLAQDKDYSLPVPFFGGFSIHATVLIVFASAFALYAVQLLDLNVYHKMIRGAVKFGEDFEENYMKEIFALNKGMTQAITYFSQSKNAATNVVDNKLTYEERPRITAEKKIRRFYRFAIWSLIAVGVGLFIITGNIVCGT